MVNTRGVKVALLYSVVTSSYGESIDSLRLVNPSYNTSRTTRAFAWKVMVVRVVNLGGSDLQGLVHNRLFAWTMRKDALVTDVNCSTL
jgi:hypothetical protein